METSLPQYKKLYEALRIQIENGIYQEGSLLPSEKELSIANEVNRLTVRQALDALVKDGYILKRKGKGSIVQSLPQGLGILSVDGTSSGLKDKSLKTKLVEPIKVVAWKEDFELELSEEEKVSGVIVIERLRFIDDEPVVFETTYLPNINLPRFSSRNLENKSLFNTLRQNYQIEVIGGEQKIWALPCDKRLSKFFDIGEGVPLLHMKRKIKTNRPGYFFYSNLYAHTANHYLFGNF